MITELSGEGEIYAGERLVRRTRYRLRITDEAAPAGVEGTIELATDGEADVLARADQLTLLLDDGRHLTFRLAGPGGRMLALGGLDGTRTSPR